MCSPLLGNESGGHFRDDISYDGSMKKPSMMWVALIVLANVVSLPAQDALPAMYVTQEGGAPLREGPDIESDEIVTLPAGAMVGVIEESGTWMSVVFINTTGWIDSGHLSAEIVEPVEDGLFLAAFFPPEWTILTVVDDELVMYDGCPEGLHVLTLDLIDPFYPEILYLTAHREETYTIKKVRQTGLREFEIGLYDRQKREHSEGSLLLGQDGIGEWVNLLGDGTVTVAVLPEFRNNYIYVVAECE